MRAPQPRLGRLAGSASGCVAGPDVTVVVIRRRTVLQLRGGRAHRLPGVGCWAAFRMRTGTFEGCRDTNVVFHIASGLFPVAIGGIGPLMLAADLAEHRGPREEYRAVDILREISDQNPELVAERRTPFRTRDKVQP